MFCPHCHNKIPDGSNICPLCYSNLAGLKPQKPAAGEAQNAPERKAAAKKSAKKKRRPIPRAAAAARRAQTARP